MLKADMRRLLAITIALLFGLSTAAPLFAIDAESSLPQCCRRDGRHHCASLEMGTQGDSSHATIASRCPDWHKATAAPALTNFSPAEARSISTPLYAHPASAPQTMARYRVAFARSRQKRGPPVISL
jgi:hypothetical protein